MALTQRSINKKWLSNKLETSRKASMHLLSKALLSRFLRVFLARPTTVSINRGGREGRGELLDVVLCVGQKLELFSF